MKEHLYYLCFHPKLKIKIGISHTTFANKSQFLSNVFKRTTFSLSVKLVQNINNKMIKNKIVLLVFPT